MPHPAEVELEGKEIIEATGDIVAAIEKHRPEAGIAACVLLAYSLSKGTTLTGTQAQAVLSHFNAFVDQGIAEEEGGEGVEGAEKASTP